MLGIPTRGLVVIGVLAVAGLLYVANPNKSGAAQQNTENTECRVTVIADILNVRTGPADTQPIVATLQRDTVVRADGDIENGFRKLSEDRWVKDEFVNPTTDSACASG